MTYVEHGSGLPMVFLHGDPTSSFLWRDILAPLSATHRCIAPDLIGMGDSDKLTPSGPDRYTFVEHRRFLDALLDSLGFDQPIFLRPARRLAPAAHGSRLSHARWPQS
jgi:haloalkane dehalogenase